jgi:NADH-quinone oxidoreductase subunit J
MATQIFFAILAAVVIVSAIGVVVNRSPVRSALNLVLVLCGIALMYLMLNATFVAAIQIIVYAGAIMVLFLFVVMVLNLDSPEPIPDRMKPQTPLAVAAGLILAGVIIGVLTSATSAPTFHSLPARTIGALQIGTALFQPNWLFPFEAVSILLLVATVGAVVLALRRI